MKDFQIFFKKPRINPDVNFIDIYNQSIDEWKKIKFIKKDKKIINIKDVFIYYGWLNTLVRLPEEKIFYELKTSRNKYLINAEEQIKYRKINVGIIGLSIGLNVLHSLVITGGPRNIRVADFDTIELTNLNRMPAPIFTVGMKKYQYAYRYVKSLDPFVNLETYGTRINKNSLKTFISSNPALDVFIDEMDDLKLKLYARKYCRQHRIPVLMATNIGNNILLDVERYDHDPQRSLFHGRISEKDANYPDHISKKEWLKIAKAIVGTENFSDRLKLSFKDIGLKLTGVPQLGSTAGIAGGVVSLAVRKIATNVKLLSGRYIIDVDGSTKNK